mmetsp:Transcript_17273/g.25902  ORF Transcript_17273/g.25902 Transcript_17273/m.25902 type:complete len:175 (-) Transcript_17273:237-761(-)|eukprot:CAMPEP_0167754204 /NCGR_PEP_ID=MMETSP0110_2-20121227/8137_1 /TAXON_ID=629695 /ORGANISM="Gymnochlora sp., Strain CCMP2014" /LENGTH=174 /DNA_ID=CAMNT_0007640051 /DNA_START=165 /DNA_END=689 /DNA_ORIENTATION=+
MVKIINGEIVPDDDPRAKAYKRNQNNSGSAKGMATLSSSRREDSNQSAYGTGQGQSGQMFSTERNGGEQKSKGLFGLPVLNIFGQTITPQMYLGLAAIAYFFGPDKAILLVVFFFFMKSFQSSARGQNAVPFARNNNSTGREWPSRRENKGGYRLGGKDGKKEKKKRGVHTLHD